MIKKILIIFMILILSIGFVSANEDMDNGVIANDGLSISDIELKTMIYLIQILI